MGIVLYTSDKCGYCSIAKDFLDSNSIKYEQRNISENLKYKEELISNKVMGLPYLIYGDIKITGFDEEKYAELFLK